ncbi:MAG TPA: hypothetical protein PKW95_14090 [bacterium]|nr:hypothetical protein [bacterium]
MKKIRLSAQLLLTITVFAAALLMQLRIYDLGLDIDREGVIVEGARAMRQGAIDYDALGVRSGRFMIEDPILRLGGNLTTLRSFWSVLRAATAAMIFYTVMVLAGAGVAFPVALVSLLLPGPWAEAWTPFVSLLVVVALLFFRRKPRQSTALLVGVALGVAIAEDPGVGLWLLLAALPAISRLVSAGKDRFVAPLLAFAGACVTLLAFAPWVRKIDLGAFAGEYLHALPGAPAAWSTLPPALYTIPPAMALLIAVGVYAYARRPAWLTPGGAADVLALSLISLALLLATLAHPEPADLLLNFAPALALGGVIFGWGWRQAKQKNAKIAAALLGVWLVALVVSVTPLNDNRLGGVGVMKERTLRLDNEFAPMQVNAREKEILENLVTSIRAAAPEADDAIFIVPDAALLYAMADRYNVLNAPGVTRLPDAKLREKLAATPPQVVVMPARAQGFAAAYPQTWGWLTEVYEPWLFVTPFALLAPRPADVPLAAEE